MEYRRDWNYNNEYHGFYTKKRYAVTTILLELETM